ncbi:hypothetical protein HpHA239_07520 [Helicobacter pylori]
MQSDTLKNLKLCKEEAKIHTMQIFIEGKKDCFMLAPKKRHNKVANSAK